MKKKEEVVPHVVSSDQGAHDLVRPQKVREGNGYHSGRPIPKPEKIAGPKYDTQTLNKARKSRFALTNERETAPGFDKNMEPSDEHIAERTASSTMSGGKAIHSGAFDSLEEVPPAFSVKKSR